MFIVRKQDLNPDGGASYLISGTYRCNSKYRWGKTSAKKAVTFACKQSAKRWATQFHGNVIQL